MYIAYNKVRMHDIDMAGILYFPRQFRFVHDALEDFLETEGLSFLHVFYKEKLVLVVVHAEANYYSSLRVDDKIEVHISVESIGNSSFTTFYKIYKQGNEKILTGTAKTVHCAVDADTRQKIPVPDLIKKFLVQHLDPSTMHHRKPQ